MEAQYLQLSLPYYILLTHKLGDYKLAYRILYLSRKHKTFMKCLEQFDDQKIIEQVIMRELESLVTMSNL